MVELTDDDLRRLATNPKEFVKDAANRAKLAGHSEEEIKKLIQNWAARSGAVLPNVLIREIITDI